MGSYEYLKRLEVKVEDAYSFRLNNSRITVWPESLDSFVSSSRQGLMKLLELDTHMMEHTLLFIQCPVHTGFKISWGLVLHFSRKDVICLCCGGNDKGFGVIQ